MFISNFSVVVPTEPAICEPIYLEDNSVHDLSSGSTYKLLAQHNWEITYKYLGQSPSVLNIYVETPWYVLFKNELVCSETEPSE